MNYSVGQIMSVPAYTLDPPNPKEHHEMKHKRTRALIRPNGTNGAALYMSSGMAPPPAPFQSMTSAAHRGHMKNKKTKSSARKIASIAEKSATPANFLSTRTPRHVQEQTGGGETHQN